MNVNVHVFICDVIVYIACHLPLTHLLGIIVQFNKFYSILFYSRTSDSVWVDRFQLLLWLYKSILRRIVCCR